MCVDFFVRNAMNILFEYTDYRKSRAVAMKKTMVSRVPDYFVEDSSQ